MADHCIDVLRTSLAHVGAPNLRQTVRADSGFFGSGAFRCCIDIILANLITRRM
jgi:hypothetical protein